MPEVEAVYSKDESAQLPSDVLPGGYVTGITTTGTAFGGKLAALPQPADANDPPRVWHLLLEVAPRGTFVEVVTSSPVKVTVPVAYSSFRRETERELVLYSPTTVADLKVGDQVQIVTTTGDKPEGQLERLPYPAQDNQNVLIYLFDGKPRRAFRAHKDSAPWVWI